MGIIGPWAELPSNYIDQLVLEGPPDDDDDDDVKFAQRYADLFLNVVLLIHSVTSSLYFILFCFGPCSKKLLIH